jgi:hypothetical protein
VFRERRGSVRGRWADILVAVSQKSPNAVERTETCNKEKSRGGGKGCSWSFEDFTERPPRMNSHSPSGLLHAFSVLDCLACSTCEEGGAGLGTLET